jgi:hypothetical protein
MNYWLWHYLCKTYIALNDLDGAISFCESGLEANNPSPLMTLTYLYAAKGDYEAAITKGMQLSKIRSPTLDLALSKPKYPLPAPHSWGAEEDNCLERSSSPGHPTDPV